MPSSSLFAPLTLPNGSVVPNRLCKAAMEENLSAPGQIPGAALFNLYRRWAEGGVGLILTGNVMISPDALTGPGGVVLQRGTDLTPFVEWAKVGQSTGAQLWMQINHPGRQLLANMGEEAIAPSAVAVDIGKHSKLLAQPRAMSEADIHKVIDRFADTASRAEEAGFSGVQIHAAHGYLLSQFLSPLVNQRTDIWGGLLENRARLLFAVIKAVRARVSPSFCVGVKLNSADFQAGGFQLDDAKWVVRQLNAMHIDLVELSGGNYESPAMQGSSDGSSTLNREAYFIDFARDISGVSKIPIMVTGGISRREVAVEALTRNSDGLGVSMLGMARAMAVAPDTPNRWKAAHYDVPVQHVQWRDKAMAGLATQALSKQHMVRMAAGKPPKTYINPLFALIADQWRMRQLTKRYRKWREGRV
jgi:2,4-dienoyl-CoA reductase-like NADH-dependent reductase (Old Yellow Enzyme family)